MLLADVGNSCEPDVLISLRTEEDTYILILIEAKYLSAKSGSALSLEELEIAQAPRDQLAREYTDILQAHEALNLPAHKIIFRALVYITAERSFPDQALQESQREIEHFHPVDEPPTIYWTNWHALHPILSQVDLHKPWEIPILDDLRKLLERKGLVIFQGFSIPDRIDRLNPGSIYLKPPVKFSTRYNFLIQHPSALLPGSVYASTLQTRELTNGMSRREQVCAKFTRGNHDERNLRKYHRDIQQRDPDL